MNTSDRARSADCGCRADGRQATTGRPLARDTFGVTSVLREKTHLWVAMPAAPSRNILARAPPAGEPAPPSIAHGTSGTLL